MITCPRCETTYTPRTLGAQAGDGLEFRVICLVCKQRLSVSFTKKRTWTLRQTLVPTVRELRSDPPRDGE